MRALSTTFNDWRARRRPLIMGQDMRLRVSDILRSELMFTLWAPLEIPAKLALEETITRRI